MSRLKLEAFVIKFKAKNAVMCFEKHPFVCVEHGEEMIKVLHLSKAFRDYRALFEMDFLITLIR